MKALLFVFLALVVGGLLYIRLAPNDPARWNVDPVSASDPGRTGVRIEPGQVTSDMTSEALLSEFDRVAMSEPRVERLAGSSAEGQITYVMRSKMLGFPDYLTVRAVPDGAGSTLAVLSRLRFGLADLGVNRSRLDRLLAGMGETISRVE